VFSDPYVVTISGASKSLNGTTKTDNGSRFATPDRSHRLLVSHNYGKRQRHTIRLEVDSLTANPLVTGQYVQGSYSVYLTVDMPNGFDTTAAKAGVEGLLAKLSATSGADITKLIGGES
jgi:hypothetical protein